MSAVGGRATIGSVAKGIWNAGGQVYTSLLVLRKPTDIYKSLAVVEHTGKEMTVKRTVLSYFFPNLYSARNIRQAKPKAGLGERIFSVFQSRRYGSYMLAKEEGATGLRKAFSLIFPSASGAVSATNVVYPKQASQFKQWVKNVLRIPDAK